MQNREFRDVQAKPEVSGGRYADLYDFSTVGSVCLDKQGLIQDINPAGARFLGKPSEALVKMSLCTFLSSLDQQLFFNFLKRVFQARTYVGVELCFNRGMNTTGYAYLAGLVEVDDRGEVHICRINIIDISERKHTEELLRFVHEELEHRVEECTIELDQLKHSLQLEITKREALAAQLRESEMRYRVMVESQTDLICRWLPDTTLTYVNDAFSAYFGKTREALIGGTFLGLINAADRIKVRTKLSILNRDNPLNVCEHQVVVLGGEIRWQRWSNRASFDARGRIIEIQSTACDITEQRRAEHELNRYREHLEELVAVRTADLQTTNKELEDFSYAIAHDLRAPLRAVTSFSQILLSDAQEKLNESECDSLNRVISASKYMAQLIDDILKLARVTRDEMHLELVDLSALCLEAIERLQQSDPDRCMRWNVQKGLKVWGDPRALGVMLNNLLENAWKYTRQAVDACIEFFETEHDGEPAFCIRDNGVGFDMQYASKLFRSFERLHSDEEFEGTGIGLTIVQHVIERHRGKVWAHGVVGEGAAVYFQLSTGLDKINSGMAKKSEFSRPYLETKPDAKVLTKV
jgi:PAS domain S-box-containing protein